jgi:pimeloyl-ACP methyl ester carboxylesterase
LTDPLVEIGIPFEQLMVKAGAHEINTIKIGSGPPLVMLHGFGAGVGFWVCNLKELSEHYTIYAIDLPGFGRSSRPTFSGKTPDEAEEYFLQSLESWRKEVQLNEVTLLGHSFGAYLAAVYSLKHPGNVHHLILADP